MKMILRFLFLLTFVVSLADATFSAALKQKETILKPEEAFKVSAKKEGDVIVTKITLGEKIYVYEDSLKYRIKGSDSFELEVEKPTAYNYDGDMVYKKEVAIALPLSDIESKVKGEYQLQILFQGCSAAGICYEPLEKQFTFSSSAELTLFDKIGSLVNEGNTAKIADVLKGESALFVILLFFIFGLLLSLTPCIFPMVPILSSILVSQSHKEKPSASKTFFISLVYVVSMALTYTVVGIIAGVLGADIQTAMQNPWVLTLFAGLFVALAFSLFGYFEIGLPASWQSKLTQVSDNAQGKGMIGTMVMGVLSALIVGPCVAPPLGGAVLFISHTGDAFLGGVALFVMSMGMGMPLLLLGIGAGKFLPKPGGWMNTISYIFGVMMLGLAIFMLSRILPDSITLLLWSLLFMGSALYIGVFETQESQGLKKLSKLFALVLLLYGMSLFIGMLSGASSMFKPFEKFTSGVATVVESQHTQGGLGYSIARLEKEVAASSKPVVVDFTKESCTACKELEHITFPDPKVKAELKRFTFITIDVTKNTPEDKALLKKFELFGTPNIIFFDTNNDYMPQKSLTGFVPPAQFAAHLKGIQ